MYALERVGDPAEIAREAHARLGVRPARPGWTDVAAVVLLPVPFLGWLVGAVLVWLSDVWRTRDKLLATLAGPGIFVLMGLLVFGTTVEGSDSVEGGPLDAGAPPPDNGGSDLWELGVFMVVFGLPLVAAIYLALRLRTARRAYDRVLDGPAGAV